MNSPALLDSLILTVRGQKVLLDADLAAIYGVPTKALNQAVKRNAARFPEDFVFQLSTKEKQEVVTNCDRLGRMKFSKTCPHATPLSRRSRHGKGGSHSSHLLLTHPAKKSAFMSARKPRPSNRNPKNVPRKRFQLTIPQQKSPQNTNQEQGTNNSRLRLATAWQARHPFKIKN